MPASSFSNDQLREFVIAGHWNLPVVKEMLAKSPDMLNARYQWGENDHETAVQAAAHVGSPHVAEFLLEQGAPLEICTAAMLGRQPDVERLLQEDPALINAHGAHGIPLMAHAALSGNVQLARMLFERGAHEDLSFALSNAVGKGHLEMSRWLLETGQPDLGWKDFQGKTALEIATDAQNDQLVGLLNEYGTG